MANHFADHDFLLRDGASPATDTRETVASILVNAGATTYEVVESCLKWILENSRGQTFHVTWYAPGSLAASALVDFRFKHPLLSTGAHAYLFPGRVDQNMESVSGRDAEEFAERLSVCFACSLLSGYSLDIESGKVYFFAPEEVRLQRACATRFATKKFLFLDSSKFRKEGDPGYTIEELLDTSESVTIYTVSSDKDEWLQAHFDRLRTVLFSKRQGASTQNSNGRSSDALRLCIVGRGNTPTVNI